MEDLNIYSGKLNYKDICFSFVYDKQELRLIPPADKKPEIRNWKMKELASGVFTMGDPLTIDSPYLEGTISETAQKVIFITRQGSSIGSQNSVLIIEVVAVILFNTEKRMINKIALTGPEINAIYSVGKAFSLVYDEEESKKGIISIKTIDYEKTTTEKSAFIVDDRNVSVHFSIGRQVSMGVQDTPLKLTSIMIFEFESTDDYDFLFRLYNIAKMFIRYLCYRKNVVIEAVELSELMENGKYHICAKMQILDSNQQCEEKTIKDGRYISQHYIAGLEGKILSDIASDTIYMRHLPDTYEAGRHIDAARFVMITAAFEWEFRRIFPEGIKKKEGTLNVEEKAKQVLQGLIDNSTGELKGIYKYLQKSIGSSPLSGKITFVGRNLTEIIDVFGQYLYDLNGEELDYSQMGERLSQQRNNYAHGNLDKDFVGLSLLDLIFLEMVLYAMQLKYYGIENIKIKRILNELFHKDLIIKE